MALSSIRSTVMNAAPEMAVPQLLAISGVSDALPSSATVAGIIHAVAAIAYRRCLRDALAGEPDGAEETEIRRTYEEVGLTREDEVPNEEARRWARDRLIAWDLEWSLRHRLSRGWSLRPQSNPAGGLRCLRQSGQ